ncbi:MAG: type II toxin-antitoxin system Phd/YefM family antitoxin [Deferrisomatales bacterium]|nr:type II toxin-antitoxin system Phd/YefM family antitoxin [Deferrisomatales bacterium]
MPRLAVTEARDNFADLLNKVAYAGERFLVERHGKPLAAIVSAEDLELLERLEDRLDLLDALQALHEAEGSGEKPVSLDSLLEELGHRR